MLSVQGAVHLLEGDDLLVRLIEVGARCHTCYEYQIRFVFATTFSTEGSD